MSKNSVQHSKQCPNNYPWSYWNPASRSLNRRWKSEIEGISDSLSKNIFWDVVIFVFCKSLNKNLEFKTAQAFCHLNLYTYNKREKTLFSMKKLSSIPMNVGKIIVITVYKTNHKTLFSLKHPDSGSDLTMATHSWVYQSAQPFILLDFWSCSSQIIKDS